MVSHVEVGALCRELRRLQGACKLSAVSLYKVGMVSSSNDLSLVP